MGTPVEHGVERVAVIGAGTIGHALAQVHAHEGMEVDMVDIDEAILKKAMEGIRRNLDSLIANGVTDEARAEAAIGRINPTTDLAGVAAEADLLLETVQEDLKLKHSVFKDMERWGKKDAILATNTATILISVIAEAVEARHRVIGTHWFGPAYIMPGVEVIPGPDTSREIIERTRGCLLALGKVPFLCKDIPGRLGARLQFALMNEAFKLAEDAAGTPEDIDNSCRFVFGLRLPLFGPLRANDMAASLANTVNVLQTLYESTGDSKYKPSDYLRQKVERGELGMLAGKGFHEYPGDPVETIKDRDKKLLAMVRFLDEMGIIPHPK